MVRVAIHGAAGRMGRRLVALGHQDPELEIVAALEHAEHPAMGQDAGTLAGIGDIGTALSAEWPDNIECVIDFSSPEACEHALSTCLSRQIPIVVATTGLTDAQIASVTSAGHSIPVCWAPNMSLAVNLTMRLAQQAARSLKQVPQGVDVEILERHHRFKEDAPSGTALKFGQLLAEELGTDTHVHGRHGQCGARKAGEIGYHAIRTGDDPGQHTIVFGMLGETIELRVAASNRDCYASGALVAAKFLIQKPAGLYNMFDVLGLD